MVLIFPKTWRAARSVLRCSTARRSRCHAPAAGAAKHRARPVHRPHRARNGENRPLQIGVAMAQHGREPGGFLFAPPFLAGLFKMAMIANRLQDSLAVNFLLEPPQRPLHRFTLLESNFRQSLLTSSPGPQTGTPCAGRFLGPKGAYGPSGGRVNEQKHRKTPQKWGVAARLGALCPRAWILFDLSALTQRMSEKRETSHHRAG